MVALSTVAVGAKITAANENAEISLINNQMGTNITPTSVTGGSIGADGRVTFTAGTSIIVNGCFTATYDTYMIFLDITNKTNAVDLQWRIRGGGVAVTTATYTHNRNVTTTANAVFQAVSATSVICDGGALAASRVRATYTVASPFLATPTAFWGEGTSATATPANLTGFTAYADQSDSISYDGFSFLVGTGTITGTLRIVGLNTGV